MNHARALRRGVSLVESLVAILLVSLVLPVAVGAVSSALRHASGTRQTQLAASLADAQLNRVLVEEMWRRGDQSGAFSDREDGTGAGHYEWALLVDTWRDDGLYELTLVVTWVSAGMEHRYELQTMVSDLLLLEAER